MSRNSGMTCRAHDVKNIAFSVKRRIFHLQDHYFYWCINCRCGLWQSSPTQSRVVLDAFASDVVASPACPSCSPLAPFSWLRGGKLSVPIFCLMTAVFPWPLIGISASFAPEAVFSGLLPSCSIRPVLFASLVVGMAQ